MDVIRFVDSISATPTVRLDLNDGDTWGVRYDGTDFSPPPLRTSWTSTLLADGALLTASAYGTRTVRLSLDLTASTVIAAAEQTQLLWRELNRPKNLLMWQPSGMSHPVFFQTFRSSSTRVTEYPGSGAFRTLEVSIDAEPFALGLKETLVSTTVTNDPAAGTNAMCFDVPAAKGDVETPLYLVFGPTVINTQADGAFKSLIAVRRRGTPSNMAYAVQAESLDLLDIASLGSDVTASNGSYVRADLAGRDFLTNVVAAAGYWPVAGPEVRGTYRVFARYRYAAAGTTDSAVLALYWGRGPDISEAIQNAEVVLQHDGTKWSYADLGLVQMPAGFDPVYDGPSGVETTAEGVYFRLLAYDNQSVYTDIDIDYLLFAPADDRLMIVKWPVSNDPTLPAEHVLDSLSGDLYSLSEFGEISTLPGVEIAGGPPMVTPGSPSRIFFALDVGMPSATSTGDDITRTTTIGGYYWPRYLTVRSPSS